MPEEAPGPRGAGPGGRAAVAVMDQCQDCGVSPWEPKSHFSVSGTVIAIHMECVGGRPRQGGLMEMIIQSFSAVRVHWGSRSTDIQGCACMGLLCRSFLRWVMLNKNLHYFNCLSVYVQ